MLAIAFTIMCILASFGGGNMFQANQAGGAVLALLQDGEIKQVEQLNKEIKDAAAKGFAFILSKRNRDDGSFGEGPSGSFMKTYTTAIALMGLATAEKTPEVQDAIRGAQAYLKANQLKEGPHAGGLGYGDAPKAGPDGKVPPARADLSVTGFAAEGLKASGLLDDGRARAVEDECRREVEAAIAAVESAPPPASDSIVKDVYAATPRHLQEQLEWRTKKP